MIPLRTMLFAAFLAVSQISLSQVSPVVVSYAEQRDEDHDRARVPSKKLNAGEAVEQLRRSVNGRSIVRNLCRAQGHDAQIEETSEIRETNGCNVTVKTRKTTSSSQDGSKVVQFTLFVNLAELTTPALLEPQSFAECKPANGVLLKVMSRAEPGKTIRTTRSSKSGVESAKPGPGDGETQAALRRDLSLFFSDTAAAKKAAQALERAVEACGGKEWPDEDNLP